MFRRTAIFTFALATLTLAFLPPIAQAQSQVPFFDRSGTAFDPEIAIVNSGIVADMQAVVSADNKYVTINARPSNSRLLALQEFAFQRPSNIGLVGSTSGGANASNASIFDRPGMTRLGPR